MKITNAKFREGNPKTEGYVVHLEFDLDDVPHYLPVDETLKPIFLRAGLVPIFAEEDSQVNPAYLVKEDLKQFRGMGGFLSDNPKLLRLGMIHFLENYHGRAKNGNVLDRLNLREVAEFGITYYEPGVDLPIWSDVVKKFWPVKIYE